MKFKQKQTPYQIATICYHKCYHLATIKQQENDTSLSNYHHRFLLGSHSPHGSMVNCCFGTLLYSLVVVVLYSQFSCIPIVTFKEIFLGLIILKLLKRETALFIFIPKSVMPKRMMRIHNTIVYSCASFDPENKDGNYEMLVRHT